MFFVVTRKEGKKRSNMKKVPKIVLFGHILIKSAHPLFGCMVTSLDPSLVYT